MISNYKVKVNDSCNYKVSITDIQNKYKFKLFCAGADLTDYYTKEQVDQSQNTQDILIDNILNQIPTGTATGETINITDSSSLPLKDIQVAGNTYQETTTGKNIFNQDNISSIGSEGGTYSNGVITTNQVTSSGTSNFVVYLYDKFITLTPNTYYLSMDIRIKSGTGSFNKTNDGTNDWTVVSEPTLSTTYQRYVYSHTYTSNKNFDRMLIQFANSTNAVYEITNIMLSTSSDTNYEKYTGGNPAPNPDYPQTITNVTGTNTIKIVGKNLFDKNNANILETFINASGVITSGNGNKTLYIACKSDTTYTISKTADNVFRAGTTDQLPSAGLSVNNKVANDTASTITITTGASAKYLVVFFKNTSSTNTEQQLLDSIQIEQGSATTYEAYKEKSYTINLGSIELCKIGDYRDRIYYSSGKWYLEKNIGKVVLDGSEDWQSYINAYNNLLTFRFKFADIKSANQIYLLSNYFKNVTGADAVNGEFQNRYNNYYNLEFVYTDITSVPDFKTWLSTHNTIVYYILATPTTTEITDTTLIGQLDALLNSTTYKTTTNIMVDTTNQKPTLTLTYRKDLETLIGG